MMAFCHVLGVPTSLMCEKSPLVESATEVPSGAKLIVNRASLPHATGSASSNRRASKCSTCRRFEDVLEILA